MALHVYKRKRNFSRTSEPTGGNSRGATRHFVVQKHQASHLHYDVRLEFGGALKSWAVPKGPSLDPKDKRLAMHVEDHPLEYRKFHGVIPPGNYGAGTVEIWDEGTYSVPGVKNTRELESIMKKKYKNGELTFELHGKKLHGLFTLVRTAGVKQKNAWLLWKRHDKSDPRAMISRDPMPRDSKPMLARVSEKPFSRDGWIFEMKWDGYRAIAEIEKGTVQLFSRERQSFNEKFHLLVDELATIPHDAVIDGEVVVLDAEGKPNFQLLQDFERSTRGTLMYMAFDLLFLDGEDLRVQPLRERKRRLKEIVAPLNRVRFSDHVETDGDALFRQAVKMGIEGVMAKRAESVYATGQRRDDWLKIKATKRQEAIICGYTEPRGSRKHIGAFILGVYRDGTLIYIGHTGGGPDERRLGSLLKQLKRLERRTTPFENPPKPNAPVHWVKPQLVCEVKFQEWTSDGIMRQPVYLGLRGDKRASEVVREDIQQASRPEVIAFTHGDKIFWPQEKYTKGDLRDYYLRIAKFILPHVKDRPISLHRYPDGIEGADFFQKDVPDAPEGIQTISLASESQAKQINYLLCNDEAALSYLVQLGCIDINPWTARVSDLDHPDYLILDLDPENVPFSAVVQTAKMTKKILDRAGAACYCKTSGSRGLHIYVPLGAKYTHEQARLFGDLVAHLVHQQLPYSTSLERSPAKRQKKVYVDFPQNKRGATTASVYSVRPVLGALVSTPLKWSEVNARLDPARFTLKSVPKRLSRIGDLWKPVLGNGVDLLACLRKLENSEMKKS